MPSPEMTCHASPIEFFFSDRGKVLLVLSRDQKDVCSAVVLKMPSGVLVQAVKAVVSLLGQPSPG